MKEVSQRRSRCSARILLLSILVGCLMMTLLVTYGVLPATPTSLSPFWAENEDPSRSKVIPMSRPLTSSLASSGRCHDVLHNMLRGRWHQRRMTPEEVERMRVFHKRTREDQYHIPKGIQRADKRCGNVPVGNGGLVYFKGLCDPDGDTPCCYDHVCQNKSVQQCTCATCEDMRTPIHAEFATWRSEDPSCHPHNWTVAAICRLLRNSTIYFIGDSLMRHVFTAFLIAGRGNFETGAFRPDTPDDQRPDCSGLYMFTEKACRKWVDRSTTLCDGSVTIKHMTLWAVEHTSQIHSAVLSLRNVTRSLVLLGIGLHNGLNTKLIWTRVLQPLLQTMKSQRLTSPYLLWAGMHQFGMMRSPTLAENNQAAKAFNKGIKRYLDAYSVPVFDTYNLTHNVMSFDGCHYGYGLDIMKVNIFLHYIQELRFLGKW